jgi:phosphoribosyl-ATP pyrophosphohydrolase
MEENISVELMVSLFESSEKDSVKEKVIEEIISMGETILDESNDDRIHINIESSNILLFLILKM